MNNLGHIQDNTSRSLISKVNEIWRLLFPTKAKTSVSNDDYVLVQDSADNYEFKKVKYSVFYGGTIDMDDTLVEWTQGKDYEPLTITRDAEGIIVSMTVLWPDGSTGLYTSTNWNAVVETYDGYNITHLDLGKTITQSSVTRDAEGAIIIKPQLIVS